MSLATLALAFAAGVLSMFAPCVLPLIPLLLVSAASQHRLGPVALGAGIIVSFTVVGLTGAALGMSIGLDSEKLRLVGAAMFVVIGAVLVLPPLQARLVTAAGPAVNWSHRRLGSQMWNGWQGQFGLGLVLGLIWTPCVGPTLASAMVLAAQGEQLWSAFATMLAFGIGATLPFMTIALLSRSAAARLRTRMASFGARGKMILGGLLILIGSLVLTGLDRKLEAFLLDISPAWLVNVTTRL